jgi:hypothetical protein
VSRCEGLGTTGLETLGDTPEGQKSLDRIFWHMVRTDLFTDGVCAITATAG